MSIVYAPMKSARWNRRRRARPVTTNFTEAQIRAALDGTFSHVYGWKEAVPVDFIPSHSNIHIAAANARWRNEKAR